MNRVIRILFKILKWLIITILSILLLLVIVVKVPAVHAFILKEATTYFNKKTGGNLTIGEIDLRIPSYVQLEDVSLDSPDGQRVAFIGDIEISLGWRFLFSQTIRVDKLTLKDVEGQVFQKAGTGWNYDFIVNGFTDSTSAPPDTTSSSNWDFSIGNLDLKNIDVAYYDYTTSDSIHAILGDFTVAMNKCSVTNNTYKAGLIALKNSTAFIRIGDRVTEEIEPSDTSTTASSANEPPLKLGLEKLVFENNKILYEMGTAPDKYFFDVGILEAKLDEIDIENQYYRADNLKLSKSNIILKLAASAPDTTETPLSIFAPIDLKLAQLAVDSVNFKMDTYGEPNAAITLNHIGIDLREIDVDSTKYAGKIEKIEGGYNQFQELKNFSTGFELAAQSASLTNLSLIYDRSSIRANIELTYDQLDSLIGAGNFQTASIDVAELKLIPDDIRQISRSLEIPDSVIVLPKDPISLVVKANGDKNKLTVDKFDLGTGHTKLTFTARANGPTWLTKDYQLDSLNLRLRRNDIRPYLDFFKVDTTYLPEETILHLSGIFGTDSTDFTADLTSSIGTLTLSGNGGGYAADTLPVMATLRSENLNYASFFGMPTPFNSDLTLQASMDNALDTNNLQFNVDLKIDTLNYDRYRLSHLKANATLDSNLYVVKFLINDSFVVANMGLSGNLEPNLSTVLKANIEGIDLQGLGFFKEDLRGKFEINASYDQIESVQKANVSIDHILFVRDESRYDVDPITAKVFLSSDSTSANVKSSFLNLNSVSNRSVNQLVDRMANTFGRSQKAVADSSAYWKLELETKDNPELRELFIPQLSEFAPILARIDYIAAKSKIDANIQIPKIHYESYEIDSLSISSTGDRNQIVGNLSLKKAGMDSLVIENLGIYTNTTSAGLHAELRVGGDSLKPDYFAGINLVSDSAQLKNGFTINILDSLILNREVWKVDRQNDIRYSPEGMKLAQLRIFKNQSELSFSKNKDENATSILANDFDLKTIAGLISTDQPLLSGSLFGNFKLIKSGSFDGKGRIENFHISKADFGKLAWKAEKTNAGFQVSINSKGGSVDFDLTGNIQPRDADVSDINLDLDLNKFEMGTLPKFLPSQFFASKGEMTADLKITGSTAKPELNGKVNFADATIGLKANGSEYSIHNQSIRIKPGEVVFNTFAVRDSSGRKLTIDGKITHKYFSKIKTDITISADEFEIANLKPGQNESIYGKLIANAKINILGRLDAPTIDAKIGISQKTNLTYIVPESQYEDHSDEGLIKWTSLDTTLTPSILSRAKQKKIEKIDIYSNTVDLNGAVNINKDATFRVVIDSAAGDYLEIQGGGDLGITYDRTGNLRLNGTYEVQDGFYQMTFYNIVKKKFNFEKGSRLVWNGDPTAATLDITAIYNTQASVAGLMMTDASEQASQTFSERLSFEVVMNLQGSLIKPEISFDIRLAPASRGAYGGAVDAKLAELRENESELNKQVFALLVLNSFISTGSSNQNLVSNQARSSASQILSQQLNALSGKYVKGVDLNFNLDSYGGAAGEGNTNLDVDVAKSFMNDRVTIRVGSSIPIEENSSNTAQDSKEIMANITLEYKITPDGAYRFKAFRKNDFEDIVVGRVERTGVGILFQHDFSRFRNIFKTVTDTAATNHPKPDDPKPDDQPENSKKKKNNR